MLATRILKMLEESPRQTPKMMADELDTNPAYVRNVLVVLQELKLIETIARGLYQITPLGREVLQRILQS